jgi:hypothetical protein
MENRLKTTGIGAIWTLRYTNRYSVTFSRVSLSVGGVSSRSASLSLSAQTLLGMRGRQSRFFCFETCILFVSSLTSCIILEQSFLPRRMFLIPYADACTFNVASVFLKTKPDECASNMNNSSHRLSQISIKRPFPTQSRHTRLQRRRAASGSARAVCPLRHVLQPSPHTLARAPRHLLQHLSSRHAAIGKRPENCGEWRVK